MCVFPNLTYKYIPHNFPPNYNLITTFSTGDEVITTRSILRVVYVDLVYCVKTYCLYRKKENPATSTHPNNSKNNLENETHKSRANISLLSSSVAGKQKGERDWRRAKG